MVCSDSSKGSISIRLVRQRDQIARCRTARERSEWRQPHRVFLIRRYQVASADRAGDGCITSRLLVVELPIGAWGEPSDLVTMATSALFIRWQSAWRSCSDSGMVSFVPHQDGQSGVSVQHSMFKCWGAKTACGFSGTCASWNPDIQFAMTVVSKPELLVLQVSNVGLLNAPQSSNKFTGSFTKKKSCLKRRLPHISIFLNCSLSVKTS